MEVKLKHLPHSLGAVPAYETEGSAGADVRSAIEVAIRPGDAVAIPTGLSFEIPLGYEIQVRPRSGLAAKNKITVTNSPGTVDSDYRGEIIVLLINHGDETFYVSRGDRVAQIVLAPVIQAKFIEVDELGTTDRGTGGFGSTGRK